MPDREREPHELAASMCCSESGHRAPAATRARSEDRKPIPFSTKAILIRGRSTMYRYSPPKSNIWGHSLRKMEPAQQRVLFEEFLKRAVAEHSFTGGSLTLFVGSAPAFLPLEAQGTWGHVTSDDV